MNPQVGSGGNISELVVVTGYTSTEDDGGGGGGGGGTYGPHS